MLFEALKLVLDPYVLGVILGSAVFGLFVGAVPGLTATMATALLVPVTFFMPPVPAIASIVTATAMAIFAGDIPSCFLRMPGTPASAAYTDEAYAMTKKGLGEMALGAGLVFSVIGGLFGTAVLIMAAPALAEAALRFSSFEYFWLVLLGLASAVFLALGNPLKGVVSLLLGLLAALLGPVVRFAGSALGPRRPVLAAHVALLAVIVPAMLPPPTPFKIFVLLAGLAGVRPVAFTLGIAIGRGFRFGGEGWLAYKYGAQATQYINDNLATVSMVVAGIVVLLGAILILSRRRRQA